MKSPKITNLKDAVDSNYFWKHLFKAIWQGKSLERSMMEVSLSSVNVSGKIIDLGAGSTNPSYLQFIKGDTKDITFTDYYKTGKNLLSIDLEKKFKLKEKYDYIFCINVFEHIFNANQLAESISKHLN